VTDARLIVVAAITGAAVMMLELMGVRLAAPWFGQSQLVWTNVIGVVLAALAAGQWLGGRWAERERGPGPAALLLAAGAMALAQPELVAWLAPRVLPSELSLLEARPFVTWGSLLVALLVLGTPMLALGAITPWLVLRSRLAHSEPGRVVGRLLGAGTAGSLVGTFGATHVLLPELGSAGTVRVAGGLLLLGSALLLGRRPPRVALLLWLALPLAAAALPGAAPIEGLLDTRETPYQVARVVQRPDGSRALLLNEGLDSYHSLRPATGVLTGAYYDAFLMPALMAPSAPDGRADVLVLGLAAGTMAWQLAQVAPELRVTGVEIDAEIVELGRRWFDLPEQTRVLAGMDGRVAVALDRAQYGAILVDAFAQQIYLPAHLTTVEFFVLLRERLLSGGVVALNVGGLSLEDPVVAALAATLSHVFEVVQAGRVPGTRNMLLLGWLDEPPTPSRVSQALAQAQLDEALEWTLDAERLSVLGELSGTLLRDGHAPLEALAHRSWRREWEPQPRSAPLSSKNGDEASALARGRSALRATRWSDAQQLLAPVLQSELPLRRVQAGLLLGNLAYERGEWGLAQSRWQTAREVVADPAIARALDGNLALVAQARARGDELAGSAGRVRGAALGVALAAALCVLGLSLRVRVRPGGAGVER